MFEAAAVRTSLNADVYGPKNEDNQQLCWLSVKWTLCLSVTIIHKDFPSINTLNIVEDSWYLLLKIHQVNLIIINCGE